MLKGKGERVIKGECKSDRDKRKGRKREKGESRKKEKEEGKRVIVRVERRRNSTERSK